MSDLVAFISDRLDEDERLARTIEARGRWRWSTERDLWRRPWMDRLRRKPVGSRALVDDREHAPYFDIDPAPLFPIASVLAHIARHDPARVLAEVAAKRAIVTEHDLPVDPCDAHDASFESVPCSTLRHLAAVYAEHPGYDATWRP